jgi:hypothetical protein
MNLLIIYNIAGFLHFLPVVAELLSNLWTVGSYIYLEHVFNLCCCHVEFLHLFPFPISCFVYFCIWIYFILNEEN